MLNPGEFEAEHVGIFAVDGLQDFGAVDPVVADELAEVGDLRRVRQDHEVLEGLVVDTCRKETDVLPVVLEAYIEVLGL